MRGIYREGFFKVSRRIIDSSLWCEDGDVIKVWLALIALSQAPESARNGTVLISRRQLGARCFLTEEKLEHCLKILSSPDVESRTAIHDGRRIEFLNNGFRVLNYKLYHDQAKDIQLSKERARAGRSGGKRSGEVRQNQQDKRKQTASKRKAKPNQNEATETETETETDTDTETLNGTEGAGAPGKSISTPWVREACDDWNVRFGQGTAPGGVIAGSLKRVVALYTWEIIRPAWQEYLRVKDPEFSNPADFAKRLKVWLDRKALTGFERGQAKGEAFIQRTKDALAEWLEGRRKKREAEEAKVIEVKAVEVEGA